MNGVEILSAQEVATTITYNVPATWIIACVTLVCFIGLGIYMTVKDKDSVWLLLNFIIGFVAAMFIGGVVAATTGTTVEYETRYKVTISDEVSMNEFLDKYEIIEQEGKIYTVRERES